MINMFSQMAYICHFGFFFFCYVLPRASYRYIWCGFIPSVVWRFSNYYFQLPRFGNLALNSFSSYFFIETGMFHTWEASVCPLYVHMPPYICMPHVWTSQQPHILKHPHMSQCSPVHLCCRGYLHVIGDVGPPYV